MTTKACTKCRVEKDLSEFSKRAASRGGLQSWCKPCTKEGYIRWSRENPEKAKESRAKWRRENREKDARWRRENPGKARWPVESLSTGYIKGALGMKDPPQELVDLKREQLLTYRATKELQKTIKEIQHGTK